MFSLVSGISTSNKSALLDVFYAGFNRKCGSLPALERKTKFYRPSSVLFSNELRTVNLAIVRLQNVDFCFDLRSDDLNHPRVRPINYRLLFNVPPRSTATALDTAVIAPVSTASPTIPCTSVKSPEKMDRFRDLESKLEITTQQRLSEEVSGLHEVKSVIRKDSRPA
ncbi:unnamed protein product [Dibothriocephalus latus]|uniref:Uncharacterized protein n=1 Tax=Dibothriocephalus latus TaxID=60516 RepID=A0A3P7LSK8_DIBLA|nr:unnamed protein product [Dibothriocephalus latus]